MWTVSPQRLSAVQHAAAADASTRIASGGPLHIVRGIRAVRTVPRPCAASHGERGSARTRPRRRAAVCRTSREGPMQHSSGFLKLVDDARRRIREVSVPDVKAMLDSGAPFHLIDVREDGEWANGHLPQAQHLCKGIIERDIEALVPDHQAQIVLYCGGGYRSALARTTCRRWATRAWRRWTAGGATGRRPVCPSSRPARSARPIVRSTGSAPVRRTRRARPRNPPR